MKKSTLLVFAVTVLSSCFQSDSKTQSKKAVSGLDTIPFTISEGNNFIFQTILNNTDTVDMYFDSGGTDLVLLHEGIKEKTSLLDGKNEDYKEEDFVPLEDGNTLTIGSHTFDSLTLYPASVGAQEAVGHFGWNLFEDKVVEMNFDDQFMILHDTQIEIPNGYTKLEIEYINTLFCVKATAKAGGKSFPNRYLHDTGFQRAIVYDKDLRADENFPDDLPVLKESVLRNSMGDKFVNKVVHADRLCFGEICIEKVPMQLIVLPNPARFKTNILGGELLKRFNTIMDFQNGFVYLKPNSLVDLPYADAS